MLLQSDSVGGLDEWFDRSHDEECDASRRSRREVEVMEHRNLDRSLMAFSIADEISQIKGSKQWGASGKSSIALVKSEHMRIVLAVLAKGKGLEEHSAEGQISVAVVEGAIRFSALGEHSDLKAGGLVTLHGGISHSVEALEDSAFVITIAL
jgi:quercetin dioxygenase-like cupin family protein